MNNAVVIFLCDFEVPGPMSPKTGLLGCAAMLALLFLALALMVYLAKAGLGAGWQTG